LGSTYTKLHAVTLESPQIVAAAQGPSTADRDITVGMELALEDLRARLGKLPDFRFRLACSSAPGLNWRCHGDLMNPNILPMLS
jgi:hypothetical protein